jgi:hypothetical protein
MVALRTGAKVVWMPTFSSVIDRRKLSTARAGHPTARRRRAPRPGGGRDPALIRAHDAVVATDTFDLADSSPWWTPRARSACRVVMTHALETLVGPDHTLAHVQELAARGA